MRINLLNNISYLHLDNMPNSHFKYIEVQDRLVIIEINFSKDVKLDFLKIKLPIQFLFILFSDNKEKAVIMIVIEKECLT